VEVTHEMLHAAMKKAVETGVMPKMADEEKYLSNWAAMRKILEAALANA
jgi:hypothetical protein